MIAYEDRHLDFLAGRSSGELFPPLPFPLAKRDGGVRVLTILDPIEHAAYRAAVGRALEEIEGALGPEVFANRASAWSPRAPGDFALEPWRVARARFRRRVERLGAGATGRGRRWSAVPIQRRPGGVAPEGRRGSRGGRGRGAVVIADVRDHFGSIRPEVVQEALGRLRVDRPTVRRVTRTLEGLAVRGARGLPVGPEPSAVLANATLADVDASIRGLGAVHVRWVDDIVAFCHDEDHGREVLETIREALARADLELAAGKSALVVGSSVPSTGFLPGEASQLGRLPAAGGTRLAPACTDDLALRLDLDGRDRAWDVSGDIAAIRFMAGQPGGAPERDVLLRVAEDRTRPVSVRGWAWAALAPTDPRLVLERACSVVDDDCPWLTRSLDVAAALAGHLGPRWARTGSSPPHLPLRSAGPRTGPLP